MILGSSPVWQEIERILSDRMGRDGTAHLSPHCAIAECAKTKRNGVRKNRVRNFHPNLIPQGLEADYDVWIVRNLSSITAQFSAHSPQNCARRTAQKRTTKDGHVPGLKGESALGKPRNLCPVVKNGQQLRAARLCKTDNNLVSTVAIIGI